MYIKIYELTCGVYIDMSATIEDLQEKIVLLTQNFDKVFKKQTRRFKKFEASAKVPRNKSKGIVIKEESDMDKKKCLVL